MTTRPPSHTDDAADLDAALAAPAVQIGWPPQRDHDHPGAGDVDISWIYRWGMWGWTWRMAIVVAVFLVAGFGLYLVVPLP